jgi:hypothetical protein
LWIRLLWTLSTNFCVNMFWFSRSRIDRSYSNSVKFSKELPHCFLKQLDHFNPTTNVRALQVFHIHARYYYCLFFMWTTHVTWYLIVVLIFISLCCYILKHFIRRAKNKSLLLFLKNISVTRKGNILGTSLSMEQKEMKFKKLTFTFGN